MKYEFHPDALSEYADSTAYYLEHDPALARRFVESIEGTIRRIIENPQRWRIVDEDVRRCLARVFPYGILYTIEAHSILIIAVMHCSREPGYWKRRKGTP